MQAIIMAAGLGTRLRPLTLTTPKPMLIVGGRPILEWTFDALPPEVTDVILVVGYLKEQIVAHFGNEWRGRRVQYVEQTDMNGTGGAVALCKPLLTGKFIVLNADDLYGAEDIAAACSHDLAILAKPAESKGRFGAFRTDAAGNLIDIIEGGEVEAGGLVNIGVYVLNTAMFDYPLVKIKDTEFGLPQTVAQMTDKHAIRIVPATFWVPIGYPEDIAAADAVLAARTAPSGAAA